MLLRGHTPSPAIENVRARTVRQLDREPRLRAGFQETSEMRWESGPDGQPIVGLFTKPNRARLWKVLTKYTRGLHFWSTGTILPIDAPPSIERIFNRETRPADYWEPLLAAAEYARSGTVITIGALKEFRYSFRAIDKGDGLSAMVLDFYQSFPYVAMMMKPGTDFTRPMRLPF
jgi:hypothetical protein